jgi:hypothetical protein
MIDDRANDILDAADVAAKVAKEASMAFAREAENIRKTAEDALEKTEQIRETERDAVQNSFLRTSAFVTDSLSSLAIDINRFIEDDVPDEVWNRYLHGEKGAFARRILNHRVRKARRRIITKYRTDSEFRDYVNRYLRQFEKLVDQAMRFDYENLLSATFLSSDVGKVYLLLSHSLKRLDKK